MRLILLAASAVFAAASPVINTWLNTSWSAVPLHCEALEFIAADKSLSVFEFVSHFLSAGDSSAGTPARAYNDLLSLDLFGADQTKKALLKMSLASHSFAPAVAAKWHYYNEVLLKGHKSFSIDTSCDSWVLFNNNQICNLSVLQQLIDNAIDPVNEQLLSFDHVLSTNEHAPVAILYADMTVRSSLKPFHDFLSKLATEGKVVYVLRLKPSNAQSSVSPLYLTGFGVELDIKSTEYKVIDDRNNGDAAPSDEKTEDEDGEKSSLDFEKSTLFLFDESSAAVQSLSKEEIKELGIKTAQVILSSTSPVDALVQITQDFPKYSHLVAKTKLTPDNRIQLRTNQMSIAAGGKNMLLLNGLQLNLEQLNIFSLLTAMRKELNLVRSLQSVSLSTDEAVRLLSLPAGQTSGLDLGWGEAFDVRDDSVVWWNDLEKDKRYKQFPASLQDLLRPSYPGQLKYIRKNIFNVVFVLDLTNLEHLLIIVDIFKFVEHSIPLRFGLVPLIVEGGDGASMLAARSFLYIIKTYGRKEAKDFIQHVFEQIKELSGKEEKPSLSSVVETAFDAVSPAGFQKFKSSNEDSKEAASHRKFLDRIGMTGTSGGLFFNGKYTDVDANWQQNMLANYPKMLEYLQMKVYEGAVRDRQNIYDYFMTLPNVHKRRNEYIFPSESHPLRFVNFLAGASKGAEVLEQLVYVSEGETASVSVQVIADFETPQGLELAQSALEFASSSPNTRIAFLHNPPRDRINTMETRVLFHKAVAVIVLTGREVGELADALDQRGFEAFNFAAGDFALFSQSEVDSLEWNSEFEAWDANARDFVTSFIGVEAGHAALVVNGRIIGPFAHPERFVPDDFESLVSGEYKERVEKIAEAIDGMELASVEDKEKWRPDAIMKLCSQISFAKHSQTAAETEDASEGERTILNIDDNVYSFSAGDTASTSLRFVAVLDPLSPVAQRAAFFLQSLSKIPGTSIKVLLNPLMTLEELPVKRFYRYLIADDLQFDEDGQPLHPVVQFKNLPTEPLLTLGLDVPRAWVIRPIESVHDLDNIKLSSVKSSTVDAHFQLRNILVEGHAREQHTSIPPRGVQYILGTPETPHVVDTITMTNLGYLQLKANPGVWRMQLREGRSRDVYILDHVSDKYVAVGSKNGLNAVDKDGAVTVIVDTFEGVTIYPMVRKRPGMENEDVIEPETAEVVEAGKPSTSKGSVWDKIKSRIWGGSAKQANSLNHVNTNATINIFSVASGHLYERFMGIMMLSVMRNTQSPVKFWLIENFLSPKFMNFIPHLAKAYNFEYEFVTYNWPHWLRATTRKERTIWAYKILFLDVIFPLNLEKVIFVDADQVVRVDMKELVDLDLEGAVYGYTPMGDSRPEMEGFRFWKTGYWLNHLRGRPYHISALYVIDLKRFRQLFAGDRLRQQYQMLSADPNSLSNLDQDLPNNMLHDIPIFSLPKEWLWCETWCADEELKTAKTIDLCNNPLTKEPKLQRAKRIIKEWVELDNLVQAVADKVEAENAAAIAAKKSPNTHDEL
ncbi:hypothetical protein HDU78_007109 [Chytriomyces hyalinus]|nr:hypothetical protein HDU78_007109 [Chytriomyces hyalinus]